MRYKYIFEEGDKEILSNLSYKVKKCIHCDFEKSCAMCDNSKYLEIATKINDKHLNELVETIFILYEIEKQVNTLKDKAINILNKHDEETKEIMDLALCNMCGIKKLKVGK